VTRLLAGVDIGGSGTRGCLVEGGRIVASSSLPADLSSSTAVGDLAVAVLIKVLAETGHELDQLASIGVGIPGQVGDGRVRHAANLGIGKAGFDLGGYVSSATRVPTLVENDMTAAAYGAYALTAVNDSSVRSLIFIGIGTGVAAGIVLEGEAYRGSRGLAGEFGHVPMGTGIECTCGSIGCLETVIGATALGREWELAPVSSLFLSAAREDPQAEKLAARAIDHLARAMWWLAAAYDPDVFYIGGGVGAGAPSIGEMVADRWTELAGSSEFAQRVLDPDRIRMYDLEEPVGAYGAALLGAQPTGSVR
jgi:predicted NBD/HSP70 family sugar kinase